jgi:predicted small secreted protein
LKSTQSTQEDIEMRTHRCIPTLVLLSALSLAACYTGAGDDAEGPERSGTQVHDPEAGAESDADGRPMIGSESAQQHGTIVDDTAPHRPGTPSTP